MPDRVGARQNEENSQEDTETFLDEQKPYNTAKKKVGDTVKNISALFVVDKQGDYRRFLTTRQFT